jgi:hypothetical protein
MTNSYCSTTPTPYYSPNGLLYRYIPETGDLEEIERTCDDLEEGE